MKFIRFAIPKGSLERSTSRLLEETWYTLHADNRTYRPSIGDPQIRLKLLRPQEIPVLVSEGLHDVGITGKDWITETHADVETMLNLEYGFVKLVLAVPKDLPVNSLSSLLSFFWSKGKEIRFSAEYLNITSNYIKSNSVYKRQFKDTDPLIVTPWMKKGENSKATILLSFGATEAKPPEDADAIVDVCETGTTLEQNSLKIIETLMESSTVFIANRKALKDSWKRQKIYDIITLLKGVVDSKKKLHIFVNVKKNNLNKLLSQLPALREPTITSLSNREWYSVNTIIDKDVFIKLLPILRKLAQGLVVHSPKQILALEEIARGEEDGNEEEIHEQVLYKRARTQTNH